MGNILTPALVSAIVTGILAPIIFYLLKRHDEIKKRNFEIRYSEYKKYLKTLDEITRSSQEDAEHFYKNLIADSYKELIDNPSRSNDILLKLNEGLLNLTSNIQKKFSKAVGELHGLRLVCSEELLTMVDQYVLIQREILNEISKMMEDWKNIDVENPNASLSGVIKGKGEQAQDLYKKILFQMRKELKIK